MLALRPRNYTTRGEREDMYLHVNEPEPSLYIRDPPRDSTSVQLESSIAHDLAPFSGVVVWAQQPLVLDLGLLDGAELDLVEL